MNTFQLMIIGATLVILLTFLASQKYQTKRSRQISKAIMNSDRISQDRRDVLAEQDFDHNANDTLDSEGGNWQPSQQRRENLYPV